jgi:hypothetical protein
MRTHSVLLCAALLAFSASAAATGAGHRHHNGPEVAVYGCLALPAPGQPPASGTWERTVNPGTHAVQVRAAVQAINNAGAALHVRLVKRGAPADVTVTPDRDLPGKTIAMTSGCLSPGRIGAVSHVTMERDFPDGLDETLAVSRQLAVAFGLSVDDHDKCSTMAFVQNATLRGCGDGYTLLQPVDRAALQHVWGTVR